MFCIVYLCAELGLSIFGKNSMLKKNTVSPDIVLYTFNLRIWKAEAGRSP